MEKGASESLKSGNSEVKRVVFIGAECTGKSTIARAIATRLGEPCSTEYVRHYVDQLDRPLIQDDLDPIARGQLSLEDEAFSEASHYVIHDTNILSSILYAEHYFSTHIDWVDDTFSKRLYDTYFLCQPDMLWVADPGQREGPREREEMQKRFEEILNRYEIQYESLGGSVEQRLETVVRCLRG
ncbi:ATP-binding protein [Puniceicoccaceae bacterium K14]|nr:ATP-binding protein [Puniceicoccaceae bacterium K14]